MHQYRDVLGALEAAEVRYVVVGGVAVALHGHLRATVDLDIVIDLVPENVTNAIGTLTALGLRPRLPVAAMDFADDEVRRSWVMERNVMVFSMWHPENPAIEVDLFAAPPIAPAELLADAEWMPLGDIQVPVVSRAHLLRLKQLAGRTQDIADIEALGEEPDADDWAGWSPYANERRAALTSMTPLQRIEWLEQTLLAWGRPRLAAERAKRQAAAEAAWSKSYDADQ